MEDATSAGAAGHESSTDTAVQKTTEDGKTIKVYEETTDLKISEAALTEGTAPTAYTTQIVQDSKGDEATTTPVQEYYAREIGEGREDTGVGAAAVDLAGVRGAASTQSTTGESAVFLCPF